MDPESGIAQYEVALGNTSGSTNILTWTPVSLDTVFEYLLSSPAINDWYYLSLRVTNVAQHVVNQSSDGQQFGGYIANIGDLEIPEMKIVPNPVVDGFIVEGLTQETNYRLYASNGQLVLNGISYPNELIDVQSLSNGTYHLELYDDKKLIHAFVKLVLER
jgi:hypothetical protein